MSEKRRVVIFEKGELLGCISLADDGRDALIRSYDSRCGQKSAQAVMPSGAAAVAFEREVAETVGRGWRVVYDGGPNYG